MTFPHLGAQALTQGFGLSLALIVAIGAQNAFVLRQGLLGAHVRSVVAFCAGMDALLIAVGVFGAAWLGTRLPGLSSWLRWGGAAFLAGYALLALRRALHPGASLQAARLGASSRRAALAQAAAFTLLNPHVYLDTVLLVGSVGAQQPGRWLQASFVLGASLASLLWFTLLGGLAQRLAPWLARPRVWQGIDAAMALLMLLLALALLRAP